MILLAGLVLGSILYMFTFIASKKNGKFYLAPIITFLSAIAVTAYGLFAVGGFEGMAYGVIGIGFLAVSIAGTLLLPLLTRGKDSRQIKKKDTAALVILPVLFLAIIGAGIYFEQGYWVIAKGAAQAEGDGNFYEISTISEGKKQVHLTLGEEYTGKEIEVENVSRWGPTEITVRIVEGDGEEKAPYIQIGLDEIKEPLKIQTTDGIEFHSAEDEKRD